MQNKIAAIILGLLLAYNVQAQVIVNKDNQILIKGAVVGTVENIGDQDMPVYSIANIDADEIIIASAETDEQGQRFFHLIFSGNEILGAAEAYLPYRSNYAKQFVDEVVKNKLWDGTQLNAEAITKYCASHTIESLSKGNTRKPKQQPDEQDEGGFAAPKRAKKEVAKEVVPEKDIDVEVLAEPKNDAAATVIPEPKVPTLSEWQVANGVAVRDTTKPIAFVKNIITQDGKAIAKYSDNNNKVNGEPGYTFILFNNAGKRLATIKYQLDQQFASIITHAKLDETAASTIEVKPQTIDTILPFIQALVKAGNL
jgi:hypothetical protein